MTVRMHHDEQYLMHVVPPVESMNKLGPEYGVFAFNAEPKAYLAVWVPLHLEFLPCTGAAATEIPDVSENFGRLFMSSEAYEIFRSPLESGGEFLPVTYADGKDGFIFNPLITAEALEAVDERLTTYDQHGNLDHFGFRDEKLSKIPIFKTRMDAWKGIFCSESIMHIYNGSALTGVRFHVDVSNPIGEEYAPRH